MLDDVVRFVGQRVAAVVGDSVAAAEEGCRRLEVDYELLPAVFDPEKLIWMNGQYLMRMTPEQIYPHLVPFLGDDPRPLVNPNHTGG